jgi:hypothetical protein
VAAGLFDELVAAMLKNGAPASSSEQTALVVAMQSIGEIAQLRPLLFETKADAAHSFALKLLPNPATKKADQTADKKPTKKTKANYSETQANYSETKANTSETKANNSETQANNSETKANNRAAQTSLCLVHTKALKMLVKSCLSDTCPFCVTQGEYLCMGSIFLKCDKFLLTCCLCWKFGYIVNVDINHNVNVVVRMCLSRVQGRRGLRARFSARKRAFAGALWVGYDGAACYRRAACARSRVRHSPAGV